MNQIEQDFVGTPQQVYTNLPTESHFYPSKCELGNPKLTGSSLLKISQWPSVLDSVWSCWTLWPLHLKICSKARCQVAMDSPPFTSWRSTATRLKVPVLLKVSLKYSKTKIKLSINVCLIDWLMVSGAHDRKCDPCRQLYPCEAWCFQEHNLSVSFQVTKNTKN